MKKVGITKKKFAERIKILRILFGFSQRDLARSSSLSKSTILRIEKGETNIRLATINNLANGFKLSSPSLFFCETPLFKNNYKKIEKLLKA